MVKSNRPLLGFAVKDIKYEFESPCSDQEEGIVPPIIDPPAHVEDVVDDNTKLIKLHHTSSVDVVPPCINLKEDVVRQGTECAYEDVSRPTFLSKEDVINDIPP